MMGYQMARPSSGPNSEIMMTFLHGKFCLDSAFRKWFSVTMVRHLWKTWGKIMQALGIERRLGCVYQSQGLVKCAKEISKPNY